MSSQYLYHDKKICDLMQSFCDAPHIQKGKQKFLSIKGPFPRNTGPIASFINYPEESQERLCLSAEC